MFTPNHSLDLTFDHCCVSRERRSVGHRLPGGEDHRHKDSIHSAGDSSRPKSRSRSRSPLRNGRLESQGHRLESQGHIKSELSGYDPATGRRFDDKTAGSSSSLSGAGVPGLSAGLKLKEEDLPPGSTAASLSQHHLLEQRERERIERERMERDRMERAERERLERERLEKEKLLQSVVAERAEREKLLQVEEHRQKLLHGGGYLPGLTSPFPPLPPSLPPGLQAGLPPTLPPTLPPGLPPSALPPGLSMLDRRVQSHLASGLMGPPSAAAAAAYPFLDRPPVPTSMWSPFDKSAMDLTRQLELERERAAVMSRLATVPSHLAALEQERLREQHERELELRRQYLDRLPGSFSAERLRMADPLALSGYFPRTISPMFGHAGVPGGIKSNSPAGLPGGPPPLIPSSSGGPPHLASQRSHDNLPSSSTKVKTGMPDSTSDIKDPDSGNPR